VRVLGVLGWWFFGGFFCAWGGLVRGVLWACEFVWVCCVFFFFLGGVGFFVWCLYLVLCVCFYGGGCFLVLRDVFFWFVVFF